MIIKSFKRYEKKYKLTLKQYNEFLNRLEPYMDYDEYCQNGNTYKINSVYYDTKDNDIIIHSISSPYYKEKLRIRSYDTVKSGEDKTFIEIKKKIDGIVSKRRVVMKYDEAMNFIDTHHIPDNCDYMQRQVMEEIKYFLNRNQVTAKVHICCERTALFAKDDRDLRITFDRKILARRDHPDLVTGSYGEKLLDDDTVLMEIKIISALPLWLTQILADLKIYPASFSKYGSEFKNYCKNKQHKKEYENAENKNKEAYLSA